MMQIRQRKSPVADNPDALDHLLHFKTAHPPPISALLPPRAPRGCGVSPQTVSGASRSGSFSKTASFPFRAEAMEP